MLWSCIRFCFASDSTGITQHVDWLLGMLKNASDSGLSGGGGGNSLPPRGPCHRLRRQRGGGAWRDVSRPRPQPILSVRPLVCHIWAAVGAGHVCCVGGVRGGRIFCRTNTGQERRAGRGTVPDCWTLLGARDKAYG